MNDLKDKNIIVTGASGGIGNSIVKKLYESGANILASGTRIEKLEQLKKKFEKIVHIWEVISGFCVGFLSFFPTKVMQGYALI